MEERDKRKKDQQTEEGMPKQSCAADDEGLNLRELNSKVVPRTNTTVKDKNGSTFLSSTSISIQGPKACLASLLSSHSKPSSSSSSSSHLQRKPKSLSRNTNENKPLAKTTKSAPNFTMSRPKPSKISSVRSNENPFFLSKWQSGKKHASKPSQRLKISATLRNSVKNPAGGSEIYGVNQTDAQGLGEPFDFNLHVSDNFINSENSTPVGKVLCGSTSNYAIGDGNPVGADSNSANIIVKTTPPVEASVSPEIHGGSSIAVLTSTTTPVCYGAGHLISGVSDKRKCRSRGILTVRGESGFENVSFSDDGINENTDSVLFKSRSSLTPMPVEASMSWSLSPLGKKNEVQRDDDDSSNSCKPLGLSSLCDSSSPSSCQFSPQLVSDSGDRNSDGNSGIVLLSPRRFSNCAVSEFSSVKKDVDSSGIFQAKFSAGQGSVAEDIRRESLSTKSPISMLDPRGFSPQFANSASPSHSADAMELKKKLDTCASWISDSTFENMSLSQLKISWREGLVSGIFDVDEFDCCRFLSDEERSGEGSGEFQHKSPQALGLRNDGLGSPEFLEQEPQILRKGKKLLSPVRHNICAESISTDASGLVTSGDSDWALCYQNDLF